MFVTPRPQNRQRELLSTVCCDSHKTLAKSTNPKTTNRTFGEARGGPPRNRMAATIGGTNSL